MDNFFKEATTTIGHNRKTNQMQLNKCNLTRLQTWNEGWNSSTSGRTKNDFNLHYYSIKFNAHYYLFVCFWIVLLCEQKRNFLIENCKTKIENPKCKRVVRLIYSLAGCVMILCFFSFYLILMPSNENLIESSNRLYRTNNEHGKT